MKALRYCLVLIAFFYTSALVAQQPILNIDTLSHKEKYRLRNFAWVYEDKTSHKSLDSIMQPHIQAQFKPFDIKYTTNHSYSYWVKFKIQSTYFKKTSWVLSPQDFRGLDYIDLYVIKPSMAYNRKLSGRLRPLQEVELGLRNSMLQVFDLEADTSYTTIYLRFQNASNVNPTFVSYFLTEKVNYLKEEESKYDRRNIQQGIFQGMLWIIIIYNILLYFSVREKSYFYYALYLFTASVYFALRNSFFLPVFIAEYIHPQAYIYFWYSAVNLATISYFIFMRSFFNTAEKLPKIDRLLRYIIGFQFLFGVLAIIYLAYTTDSNGILRIAIIPGILQVLSSIYVMVRLNKEGGDIAKYFVYGSASLLVGVIVYNAIFYSVIAFGFLSPEEISIVDMNFIIEIGVIVEILFFSYGLGKKIQLTEQDKLVATEQLVKQLTENERIQIEANQHLEGKVQERTAELQETIEELNTSLLVINTQKKEIEKKNEDITASINYARRIQTAMLATEEEVQRSLPDSFIFFRPRDIVSGDFYYYQEVQHSIPTVEARVAQQIPYEYIHQQKIIIAAVDCTGHGVPGAFMSMVGNEILSEIINVKDIYQPSEILTELHKGIRKALKQQETMNKDGMDLTLLTLTKENDRFITAEYSGAMNPLYYFEVPKDREVAVFNEIKATKRPIGGQLDEKSHQTLYVNHTIQLQEDKNYTFYLFTDGFQDQFGGEHNKKFMVKRFKEMLYDIQHLDMLFQKVTITQTFEAWTEGYEQIDDVLVMGVRII